MAVHAGRHTFGAERGRIALRTFRDGLASQAGHDLVIEITRWSGELTVADDLSLSDLTVRIDMNSLVVHAGTGGLKPLTDRDRREIATTARKVLGVDRHPVASFTASAFEPGTAGGGVVLGTLALAGAQRPLPLRVAMEAPGEYHATATVTQSEFGIKPYAAFLGALRVRDEVDVDIEVSLDADGPESGQVPGAQPRASG
jgi:polyisoprenoid-binding protein YceI